MQNLINNLPNGFILIGNKIYKGTSDNFLRKHKSTWVATVYKELGFVSPTHGYFAPHTIGKRLLKHFGKHFNNK